MWHKRNTNWIELYEGSHIFRNYLNLKLLPKESSFNNILLKGGRCSIDGHYIYK